MKNINYTTLLILLILTVINCRNADPQIEHTKTINSDKTNLEIARLDKEKGLIEKLKRMSIDWEKVTVHMQAYKIEKKLEIWVKNKEAKKYKKLIEYNFCNTSGELGPKRKEGDKQIPEGLYKINVLNPFSSYYLSLGVNYPNKSDKIRGQKSNLGGDIYIHGGCATIGCIPITDDKIKELYILAEKSKKNGQEELTINIFPFKMTDKNLKIFEPRYKSNIKLWNELKPFYEYFEKTNETAKFRIMENGSYIKN